jgi:signal transduction histidine kinase
VREGKPFVIEEAETDPVLRDWLAVQRVACIAFAPCRRRAKTWCIALEFLAPRTVAPRFLEVLQTATAALAAEDERRAADEARRTAEHTLVEERARVARDIHDTLAQGFTGVLMQINAATDGLELGDVGHAARHIERAAAYARLGLAEARRSVFALRPPLEAGQALADALRLAMGRMFDGLQIEVELRVSGIPRRFPIEQETELFRIVQEAFGNTVRHAQATRAEVVLDFGADALLLRARDDGRGFDPEVAASQGGFGLVSMRERAARIGAVLALSSAAGSGTTVSVTLPYDAAMLTSRVDSGGQHDRC